jgi:hypothetical protein
MQINRAEMISFGAGVNSVAMTILLVNEGWRGPIIFADPGGEHPETYCYLEYFERDFLRPHGLEIMRLTPATHAELYDVKRHGGIADSLEAFCLMQGIIPLLSVRWCSVMFKREPLETWRQANDIAQSLQGMTIDEPARIRDGDSTVRYPLDERGINRAECRRIIQRAGLEVPRKSGCFFCPGQSLSQWRNLYLEYPELFERAIQLEENAATYNQKWATLDPHGVRLEDMRARRWQGLVQMDLTAWLPCACRL